MPQYQIHAPITATKQITADIFRITLHAPAIADSAQPGQFVMVKTTEGYDPLLRRPFSIHDVPDNQHIRLLYKVLGKGTVFLSQLKKGQKINIVGPLGNKFKFDKHTKGFVVGGGMGIAPLLFLSRRLKKNLANSNFTVLLGARNIDEIKPLADDFLALDLPIHCATDDGSYGHHGFVTELFPDTTTHSDMVFVCGPTPLMAAMSKKCEAHNISCQASLETHMACGLGACLGCTIHASDFSYKHVCKHGPIFDASEVLWTL